MNYKTIKINKNKKSDKVDCVKQQGRFTDIFLHKLNVFVQVINVLIQYDTSPTPGFEIINKL